MLCLHWQGLHLVSNDAPDVTWLADANPTESIQQVWHLFNFHALA